MVSEAEKIYTELLRQTERRLDAQRELASQRDQRALVVAAFSTAFSGVALRSWAEASGATLTAVTWAGASVFLGLAAIFAAVAAMPRPIHGAGYHFRVLAASASSGTTSLQFIATLAVENDKLIDLNDRNELIAIHCYRFALLAFMFGVAIAAYPLLTQ